MIDHDLDEAKKENSYRKSMIKKCKNLYCWP